MDQAKSEAAEGVSRGDAKSKKAVEALGHNFAEYIRVDYSQQVQSFDDGIEELLTRLDEYHGLLDMIRSDTSLCLQRTLPTIQAKTQDIHKTFDRIDKLESLMTVIKGNVATLEEQVEKADTEMGSFSSIKKVFNSISLPSFLSPKKPQSPSSSPVRQPSSGSYQPPTIFKTSDYIVPRHQNTPPQTNSPLTEAATEPCEESPTTTHSSNLPQQSEKPSDKEGVISPQETAFEPKNDTSPSDAVDSGVPSSVASEDGDSPKEDKQGDQTS